MLLDMTPRCQIRTKSRVQSPKSRVRLALVRAGDLAFGLVSARPIVCDLQHNFELFRLISTCATGEFLATSRYFDIFRDKKTFLHMNSDKLKLAEQCSALRWRNMTAGGSYDACQSLSQSSALQRSQKMERRALLGELKGPHADQSRALMYQGRTLMNLPPSNQIKPNQTE